MSARRLGLATVALVFCASTGAAQSSPPPVVAMRDSVSAISNPGTLATLLTGAAADHAGGEAARQARLGWIYLREGELASGRDELDQAVAAFDQSLLREHGWADTWVGLARTKLLLAERHEPVKRSVHQPAGEHYDDAALDHLVQSLKASSSNPAAIRLLTDLLMDREVFPLEGDLAKAVRMAGASPANGPMPHLFAARDQRLDDHLDSARAELAAFFSLGGDSALGLLERARTEYRQKLQDEAVVDYLAGAQRLDSISRPAYRRDLGWTAHPDELATYDSLPADSLGPWVAEFWARRSAASLQPPHAALLEHFRRWVYAVDNFRLTGRPRGASLLGISTTTQEDPGHAAVTQRLFEVGVFRNLPRETLGLDDRGLIYLRFGEPSMRVASHTIPEPPKAPGVESAGPCAGANESWRYDLPDGSRYFHFCGNAAPTDLVPRLPLNPDIIGPRVAMDARYARVEFTLIQAKLREELKGMAAKAGGGIAVLANPVRVQPEAIQATEREGEASIRAGLTHDSYTRYYRHDLEPTVQVYGLGQMGRARSMALVVFAIPGDRLTPEVIQGRIVYPVHIRLTAVDSARGATVNVDTTRYFVVPDTLAKGRYLDGTAALALAPGSWYVRALFEQPDQNAGGAVGRSGVTVPATEGALGLSDIVLGRDGGLTYHHGNESIALNPLATYSRAQPMAIYYELHGATPGESYTTDVQLARLSGGKPSKSESLTLQFTDRADAADQAIHRTIDLSALEPGTYLLSVEVGGQPRREVVVRVGR